MTDVDYSRVSGGVELQAVYEKEGKSVEDGGSFGKEEIVLSWKNLKVVSTSTVNKIINFIDKTRDVGGKELLKGVDGQIAGGLWAIMVCGRSARILLLLSIKNNSAWVNTYLKYNVMGTMCHVYVVHR
jgi:hypothetical protein